MIRTLTVTTLLCLFLGCGPTTADVLKKDAAKLLGCTEDQMAVHKIDNRTMRIAGCGKQVNYFERCQGDSLKKDQNACTWEKDSEVIQDEDKPAEPVESD